MRSPKCDRASGVPSVDALSMTMTSSPGREARSAEVTARTTRCARLYVGMMVETAGSLMAMFSSGNRRGSRATLRLHPLRSGLRFRRRHRRGREASANGAGDPVEPREVAHEPGPFRHRVPTPATERVVVDGQLHAGIRRGIAMLVV